MSKISFTNVSNLNVYIFVVLLLLTGCGGGGNGTTEMQTLSTGGGYQSPSPSPSPLSSWAQQAYLKAVNNNSHHGYGYSVAVDRDTVIVGALGENSGQTTITNGPTASSDTSVYGVGAAYVYTKNGTTWSQQAYLKAANARMGGYFGTDVAVSGDTAVVSAYAESSNQTTITNGSTASSDTSAPGAGAVYVYTRTAGVWTQQAYIKAPNIGSGGDRFGTSIALDGDTLIVGAVFEASNQTTITNGATASSDNSLPRSGAVYVFTRSGTTWSQQAYLKPPNTHSEDRFGHSVSISGDTLVATSVWESSAQTTITNGNAASTDTSASHAGAAYVFTRSGGMWSQQAYLKAANANASDAYGVSSAISGNTVAIGANGEASNQTSITNGTTASADNSAAYAGAVYVYTRTGVNWQQQAYLKAANAQANNWYGYRVALDGDTLVVGSPQESSNQNTITNGMTASSDASASHAGAVYVYTRSTSDWTQQAYIKPANASAGYFFGGDVAIKGNTVVVGSNLESSAVNTITNGSTASSDASASGAGAGYVYYYQ